MASLPCCWPPVAGIGVPPIGVNAFTTPCAVAVMTARVCSAERVWKYMVGLNAGAMVLVAALG
ncbi:MAG: hypothetical protein ACM3MF_10305 [Anaerolineae bacterium]